MLVDPQKKLWAVVRIVLGTAQIVAAGVTLILGLRLGANWLTETCIGVTLALVLLSRLLFGGKPRVGNPR